MLGYNYCNPNKDRPPPRPGRYFPFFSEKVELMEQTQTLTLTQTKLNVFRARAKKLVVVFSTSVSHNATRRGRGNAVL